MIGAVVDLATLGPAVEDHGATGLRNDQGARAWTLADLLRANHLRPAVVERCSKLAESCAFGLTRYQFAAHQSCHP